MNSQERKRVFKLAFPLKFKRKGSNLMVIDRFSECHEINFEKLVEFDEKSIDKDNFILFEVKYSKPVQLQIKSVSISPQAEAGVNGYVLFHSSVSQSKGHGTAKSIYEYYKRRDLSYYILIKKEGDNGRIKSKQISLGSLLESNSRIRQTTSIINRNFDCNTVFDRKRLAEFLPSNLANRQVMKGVLDILCKEGFLKHAEKPIKIHGREVESFVKSKKLEMFIIDPRSFLKPNGVNVGQER